MPRNTTFRLTRLTDILEQPTDVRGLSISSYSDEKRQTKYLKNQKGLLFSKLSLTLGTLAGVSN